MAVLESSVSSTEGDVDMLLAKEWTAIRRLSIIGKSDLSDKIKLDFFQEVVVSTLLCGCTIWTLTKRIEKKLDRNCFKNATSYTEQILEATPYETTAVRPLARNIVPK